MLVFTRVQQPMNSDQAVQSVFWECFKMGRRLCRSSPKRREGLVCLLFNSLFIYCVIVLEGGTWPNFGWGCAAQESKCIPMFIPYFWTCIPIFMVKCWTRIPKYTQKPWKWIPKLTFKPFSENTRTILMTKSREKIPKFIPKMAKKYTHLGGMSPVPKIY